MRERARIVWAMLALGGLAAPSALAGQPTEAPALDSAPAIVDTRPAPADDLFAPEEDRLREVKDVVATVEDPQPDTADQADEIAADTEGPTTDDLATNADYASASTDDVVAAAQDAGADEVPTSNDDDALFSSQDAPAELQLAAAHTKAKPKPRVLPPISEGTTQVIDWVRASRDNGDLPFMVLDKVQAQLLVFDVDGGFVSKTAVLIGITKGDNSTPGIGNRELFTIPKKDRTTPAGRFPARFGPAAGGHGRVFWVDYGDSIALHPVVTSNPKEQRVQRLRSATAKDNRITYGCINVPAAFYTKVVSPMFNHGGGIVYVLPEQKPLKEVFPSVDLAQSPSDKVAL